MSYRIYVNKSQWLGNNEFPEEIITELKRQGAEFDEDGIFKFQLKDLEGLLEACELYVKIPRPFMKAALSEIADIAEKNGITVIDKEAAKKIAEIRKQKK